MEVPELASNPENRRRLRDLDSEVKKKDAQNIVREDKEIGSALHEL